MLLKHKLMAEEQPEEATSGGAVADEAPAGPAPEPKASEAPEPEEYPTAIADTFKKLSEDPGGDDHSAEPEPEENADGDDHSTDGDGEEVEETASTFDDELLGRARMFGFEEDDLKSFDSPQQLERTLSVMSKRMLDESGSIESPEQDKQPAEQDAKQEPTDAKEGEEKSWRDDLRNTEDWDPVFGKLVDHIDAQEKRIEEMEQRYQQREAQLVTQQFYDLVDGLPEPFDAIYGKDQSGQISPEAWKQRDALFAMVAKVGGVEGLRRPELIKQMAVARNSDDYEKHLTRKTHAAAKRNGAKAMRRAGGSTNTPKTPPDDGEYPKAVGEAFRQMSYT